MKLIFTAALAASLLGGTAVMAQPGDQNRDRGRSGEQADRQADRKAQKTEDKADRRDNKAAPAGPSDRADSRPQGRGDRNAPDVRVSQPVPAPSAAPTQAMRNASPQGRGDRNAPDVRTSQPAPAPSVAPSQAMRDASPYAGRRGDRMPAAAPVSQYQAPQYQAPQNQTRNMSTRSGGDNRTQATRWSRGDRVPDQYRQQDRYHVNDWQQYGLRQPPGGYRWIRDDNNDFYLSLMSTTAGASAIRATTATTMMSITSSAAVRRILRALFSGD